MTRFPALPLRILAHFAFSISALAIAGSDESRAASYGFAPGELVPDLQTVDVDGRRGSLRQLAGKQGLVLITRDLECPVSQRYLPRIREMANDPRLAGFRFVIVDVTPHGPGEARSGANALPGVLTIVDGERKIATALRAETTAEGFVIDVKGTLRYRGAIDDQYGITYQRAEVRSAWLRRALEKIAVGEDPHETRTDAPGCALSVTSSAATPSLVDYHNRISRIIQSRCQVCHRVDGLGPMPLENYRQVYERRAAIAAMVRAGLMPPWSADRKVGEWANDRSLNPRDKADLLAWIDSGAPEGKAADSPLPRKFDARWTIGTPDAVIAIPEPIRVPAQGVVDYKYVYVKTNFPEDIWVTAMQVRPTQPKAVHHVIVLLEEPGRKHLTPRERAKLRPGDPVPPEPNDGATGFFGITVPGSLGIVYPSGTGKRLPKGAWLKFEIHYQPTGAELTDQTQLGLRYSTRPLQDVESRSASNAVFAIPPNHPRYEVKASYTFKEEGTILSLFPHAHLRGTAFRYALRYPDGRTVRLLEVPKFDFNWQSYYEFRKPFDVPVGAKLVATAWYDNSKNNPWNPDPSKTVRWGPQTSDEMMIGYFDFAPRSPSPGRISAKGR